MFNESTLKALVERRELGSLDYDESRRIVESFYSVVDTNDPPYKNLIVDELAKRKIIEKSKGNAIIIKLFFEHMYFKSSGNFPANIYRCV